MRIYFGPGRWFEDVTDTVTPAEWYGFEFRVEKAGAPDKRYRVYLEDLEFLPQEARERVAAAIAGEFAQRLAHLDRIMRHMNG